MSAEEARVVDADKVRVVEEQPTLCGRRSAARRSRSARRRMRDSKGTKARRRPASLSAARMTCSSSRSSSADSRWRAIPARWPHNLVRPMDDHYPRLKPNEKPPEKRQEIRHDSGRMPRLASPLHL